MDSLVKDYSQGQLEKVLAEGRSQFEAVQHPIPEIEDAQLYVKGFAYGYVACFYTFSCSKNWNPNNSSTGYQPQPLLDPDNLPLEINHNYLEIIIKAATEHSMETLRSTSQLHGEKLFEKAYTDGYVTCIYTYGLSEKMPEIPSNPANIPHAIQSLIDDLVRGWEK